MPFRTEYGKHYHMTEGCHGATIPCGTEGLSPCSDCCGGGKTNGTAGEASLLGGGSGMGGGSGSYATDQYLSNEEYSDTSHVPVDSAVFAAALQSYIQNGGALNPGHTGSDLRHQEIDPTRLTSSQILQALLSPSLSGSMPAPATAPAPGAGISDGQRREEELYQRIASGDEEFDKVMDEYEDALRTRYVENATANMEGVSAEAQQWNDQYEEWLASDPLHSPAPDVHVSKEDIEEEMRRIAREEGRDWDILSDKEKERTAKEYQPEAMRRIFYNQQVRNWLDRQIDEGGEAFAIQVTKEVAAMMNEGAVEWQGKKIGDPELFEAALLMADDPSGINARRGGPALQRQMKMGYARALRLIDSLESLGVISPMFDVPASGGGFVSRRRRLMDRNELIRSFVSSSSVAQRMFDKERPEIAKHRAAQSQAHQDGMKEVRRRKAMMEKMRPQSGDEEALRDFATTLRRGFDALS